MKPHLVTWFIALGCLLIGCRAQNPPSSYRTDPTPSRPTLGLITPSLAQTLPIQAPVATQQSMPVIATVACQQPSTWISYTVLLDDTLSELAYRSGTSVAQLQQINCLNDTLIFAGQQLYLPTMPSVEPTNQIAAPAEPSSEPPPNPDLAPIATHTIDIPTPIPGGPNDHILQITPAFGIAGTSFNFQYKKFAPHASITYTIYTETFTMLTMGELTADSTGKVIFIYVSPANAAIGSYLVKMESEAISVEAAFEIIGSTKAPPDPTLTKISPTLITTPINSSPTLTPNSE